MIENVVTCASAEVALVLVALAAYLMFMVLKD